MKRVRFVGALAALVFAAAIPAAAFAAAEDAIGTWNTDMGGVTQVYSCPGGICIKVVTPNKDRAVDANNPDPALKGRPMAGAVIMSGAVKDGADRWKGEIYNSEDGKLYRGYVEVKSKEEVKLEGCILGGLVCKSHSWHRAQ